MGTLQKREWKTGNFQKAVANAQRRYIQKPSIRRKLKKLATVPSVKAALSQLEVYVNTHNYALQVAAAALSPGKSFNFDTLQAYLQSPYMREFNSRYCAIAETMLDSVCRAARLFCCAETEGNHSKECKEMWKSTLLKLWYDFRVVKTWENQ